MLDKDLLKKVELIQLQANQFVNSLIAGEYASAFKGKGLEFEEVREYVAGDDFRTIDWNVTSRTGIPHVKRYQEERNLKLYLALDLSGSGLSAYDGKTKREILAQIAAVFSLVALKKKDEVSLLLFTDTIELFIPPAKGHEHTLRLIRDILKFEPEGHATNINVALSYLNKIATHDSLILLMSDFHSPEFGYALGAMAKHFDIVALAPYSPFDFDLPNVGVLTISDGEGNPPREIDTSNSKIQRIWREQNLAFQETLKKKFQKLNISYFPVQIAKPWEQQLSNFLLQRIHNKRR